MYKEHICLTYALIEVPRIHRWMCAAGKSKLIRCKLGCNSMATALSCRSLFWAQILALTDSPYTNDMSNYFRCIHSAGFQRVFKRGSYLHMDRVSQLQLGKVCWRVSWLNSWNFDHLEFILKSMWAHLIYDLILKLFLRILELCIFIRYLFLNSRIFLKTII